MGTRIVESVYKFKSSHHGLMTHAESDFILYLAHRMNDENKRCDPPLRLILEETELARSTLYKVMDSLVEKGILRIDMRKKTRCYHFLFLTIDTKSNVEIIRETPAIYVTQTPALQQ